MGRAEYVDVTGTLRKAQRQVESGNTKAGLRLLRTLEPDDLDPPERLRFYYLRALVHLQRQDAARARPDLQQGAALAEQLHNTEAEARIANLFGWAHTQQNRPAMALEYHQRARWAVQAGIVNDPPFAAMVYGNLGSTYWALGDYARAGESFREALRMADETAPSEQIGAICWGLALAEFHAGQALPAGIHARRALEAYEQAGNPAPAAQMRLTYAAILFSLGNADEAGRQLQRVLEETDDPRLRAAIHRPLSEQPGVPAAPAEVVVALVAARTADTPALLVPALLRAAELAEAHQEADLTRLAYLKALRTLADTPRRDLLSQVLVAYAGFLGRQGAASEAIAIYERAYEQAALSDCLSPFDTPLPALPGFTPTAAGSQERRAPATAARPVVPRTR